MIYLQCWFDDMFFSFNRSRANYEDVGFEVLYGSSHRLSSSEVSNVESELISFTINSPAQAKALESAFHMLTNKKSVERIHNDVKIFIEACIARSRDVRGGGAQWLCWLQTTMCSSRFLHKAK